MKERNRIIDAQIANAPPAPAIDPAVIEELQRRDLQRRAQATVETWVKMIAALYDKGAAYTTRSVFDRYDITIEQDQVEASDKLEKYLERQAEASKVVPLRKAN